MTNEPINLICVEIWTNKIFYFYFFVFGQLFVSLLGVKNGEPTIIVTYFVSKNRVIEIAHHVKLQYKLFQVPNIFILKNYLKNALEYQGYGSRSQGN